jgi:hypothetical protein
VGMMVLASLRSFGNGRGLVVNITSGLDFMALHIAQRISISRAVRLGVLVASAMLAEEL